MEIALEVATINNFCLTSPFIQKQGHSELDLPPSPEGSKPGPRLRRGEVAQQALGPRLPSDFELMALARSGNSNAAEALIGRHIGAVASLGARPLVAAPAGGSPDTEWLRSAATDALPVRAAVLARHSRGSFDPRTLSTEPLWLAFASLPAVWRTALWHREVEGQRPSRIGIYLGMTVPDATRALLSAYAGLLRAIAVNHPEPEEMACASVYEEFRFRPPAGLDRKHSKALRAHAKSCSGCASLAEALLRSRTELRGVLAETVLGAAAAEYLASRPVPPKLPSDGSSRRPLTRTHKVLSPAFALGLAAAMALVVVTNSNHQAATQTPPSAAERRLVAPSGDLTPVVGPAPPRMAIRAVEGLRSKPGDDVREPRDEGAGVQPSEGGAPAAGGPREPLPSEPPPGGTEEPTPTEPEPKPEPPPDDPGPVDVDPGDEDVVIVVDPGPVLEDPVVIEVPVPDIPADPVTVP